MPIVWGEPPPVRLPRSWIRLLCVKPKDSVTFARLGPVVGLQTHWVPPKTIACLGSEECPVHHLPQTWKGYAPCIAILGTDGNGRPTWRLAVVVVTPEVSKEVDLLKVGCPASLTRQGSRKNSPLSLLGSRVEAPPDVPEAFDVRPYVLRAMGYPGNYSGQLRIAQ
jgi:hypothetical protein